MGSCVVAAFRAIDGVSGEGTISECEWLVLDQLFEEMNLCLEEFVKFLERAFGCCEQVLERAWQVLDEDSAGELTEDNWKDVVEERFNYFGPSKIIYHFLDKDDGGTISWDEFRTLERFV